MLWLDEEGVSLAPSKDASQSDLPSLLISPGSILVVHMAGRECFPHAFPHWSPPLVVHAVLSHPSPLSIILDVLSKIPLRQSGHI